MFSGFLVLLLSAVSSVNAGSLRGGEPLVWSYADESGCLETKYNYGALWLTEKGVGIDGAKRDILRGKTCEEQGYETQTDIFFGDGDGISGPIKLAYTGVTWWVVKGGEVSAQVAG